MVTLQALENIVLENAPPRLKRMSRSSTKVYHDDEEVQHFLEKLNPKIPIKFRKFLVIIFSRNFF